MSWWEIFEPPQISYAKAIQKSGEILQLELSANTCKHFGRDAVINASCPNAEEYKKLICNYCTVNKYCKENSKNA